MHPYLGDQEWVTAYGAVLLVALATWWRLSRRSARKEGLEPSHVDLLLPLALVAGIALSAVASAVLPGERLIVGTALSVERRVRLIPLALGGMVAVLVYGRATSQSGRRLLDLLAVPTLVGLAIQRVGCFLAGCCWGDVAGDGHPLAVAFPIGSFAWEQQVAVGLIEADALRSLPVHPTQLYEAGLLVLLALFMRWGARGLATPGGVALASIVGYATLRFGVDLLRADSPPLLGPLTLTQIQCAVLFVVGLALLPGRLRAPARGHQRAGQCTPTS
jgi:phosphatidylglycerol:prolipoprotein diacylglycerol transferase